MSYDFDLQGKSLPHAVEFSIDVDSITEWVTDGCTTIEVPGSNQIMCECDHLTNFASLVVRQNFYCLTKPVMMVPISYRISAPEQRRADVVRMMMPNSLST